jgi:hypothetical protein
MQLNVTYDANTLATAPSEFFTAVNYVVALFDATFTNTATVSVEVGYGDFPFDGSPLTSDLGESQQNHIVSAGYSQVRQALVDENAPGASTLPSSSPISGTLQLGSAEEKALGLIGASSALDGWVGIASDSELQAFGGAWSFGTTATPGADQYYLVGVLEHEFTEVMGRTSFLDTRGQYSIIDLYRYAGAAIRKTNTGDPAYFSIDNGDTNLDSFNDSRIAAGDLADWAPNAGPSGVFLYAGADAFDNNSLPGQINGLSSTDLTLMGALGWGMTSPSPPPQSPPPPPPQRATGESPVVLSDFSWAQGWGSADNPRIVSDVNGDGNSDYLGFGYSSTFIAYGGTFAGGGGTGPGFSSSVASVEDFGTSEGYTASAQRGAAAAGVGDGDILYGQGYAGVYWYEATGESAKTDAAGITYEVLQYQATPSLYGNFGTQQGWTSDNGFQILKTGSSDSSASILGFGDAGIVVGPDAFASGASASSDYVIALAVGNNSGWKQSVDIRTFTDQNGRAIDLNSDGVADFVGMGPQGLVYAYGSGSGASYTLGALKTAHIDGGGSDLGEAQGWTDATTVRDIVHDRQTGFYDIIAFGAAGVYVAMGQDPATHNGEPWGQLYLALADFGSNEGWTVSSTPRLIGDVTGDGVPDIVGFGTSSTFVAVGSRDSSGNLQFKIDTSKTIADFGAAEGWSGSTEQSVRALGTIAASGTTASHSDLILSGASNTQIWHFT